MLHRVVIAAFVLCALSYCAGSGSVRDAKKQPRRFIAWTTSWSHDDGYIAVGNDNGELSIYETKRWTKIKKWHFNNTTITRIEWNPKHLILAVAAVSHKSTEPVVQLYDLVKDRVVNTIADTLYGRAISWSSSGEEIAIAGAAGKISILGKDGSHRKTLSFTNPGSLFDIDWHPHQNMLLAVEEDIYLLDIDKDRLVAKYDDREKEKGILCTSWHPSGTYFITGDYGHEKEGGIPSYLRFWNLDGKLLHQVKDGKSEYRNVKWSANGSRLAAATDALLICDKAGTVVRRIKFDDHDVWGVAWNSSGDRIASTDGAGNVRVTDTTGKVLHFFIQ